MYSVGALSFVRYLEFLMRRMHLPNLIRFSALAYVICGVIGMCSISATSGEKAPSISWTILTPSKSIEDKYFVVDTDYVFGSLPYETMDAHGSPGSLSHLTSLRGETKTARVRTAPLFALPRWRERLGVLFGCGSCFGVVFCFASIFYIASQAINALLNRLGLFGRRDRSVEPANHLRRIILIVILVAIPVLFVVWRDLGYRLVTFDNAGSACRIAIKNKCFTLPRCTNTSVMLYAGVTDVTVFDQATGEMIDYARIKVPRWTARHLVYNIGRRNRYRIEKAFYRPADLGG